MSQKPRKGSSKDESPKKPARTKAGAPAPSKPGASPKAQGAGAAKAGGRGPSKPPSGRAAKGGASPSPKKTPSPSAAASAKAVGAKRRAAGPAETAVEPKGRKVARKAGPGPVAGGKPDAATPKPARGLLEKVSAAMADSEPQHPPPPPPESAGPETKPPARRKPKAPKPETSPSDGGTAEAGATAPARTAPAAEPPAPTREASEPAATAPAAVPPPPPPTRLSQAQPPAAPLPPPRGASVGQEDGWIPIEQGDGWSPIDAGDGWIPIEEGEDALGAAGHPGERRDAPRLHDIPPIPDEADEFEPIEEGEEDLPAAEPPPGSSPHDVLEGVRAGELHISTLNRVSDDALAALAADEGLEPRPGERRSDLLVRLLGHRPPEEETKTFETEGLLEILPDGYGFLRKAEQAYAATPEDAYVPGGLLRKHGLLTGHWLTVNARTPRSNERYPCVVEITEVNHEEPAALERIVPFDKLTVTHPDRRLLLETTPEEVSMRLMDLFCPLGRGQRGLIVSPPRAGKTILMTKIADSIARNSPEVEIVVLLLDERPEEVTNMRRSVRGEVIGSTFDQPPHRHIRLAELVMEKVKRMVEFGRHVVLLLDSLTRLGRAYNNESGGTGRLLTGGLEASALTKPKRFFGAARNIEHGGSLTIVATALVDTGSRLDQVIFEEFKGTGNMEVVLSRELANQRLWPAIDIPKSGTRKEELLLHPEEQRRITAIRRAMSGQEAPEALTDILSRMKKHKTNAEFLMNIDLGSLSAGRDSSGPTRGS